MAKLNKDAYLWKAEYAARNQQNQKSVKTLTEEQHEALAEICNLRHFLHSCDRGSIINGESGDYDSLISTAVKINNLIKENNLGTRITDYVGDDEGIIMEDWHEVMCEDEKAEYEDFHDWYARVAHPYASEVVEKQNDEIEKFLRGIDTEHGTNYAPTGATRIF